MSEFCDSVDLARSYTKKELDECVRHNRRVIQVRCHEFDKYGRVLVTIPRYTYPEETVNDWMVRAGYGVTYRV